MIRLVTSKSIRNITENVSLFSNNWHDVCAVLEDNGQIVAVAAIKGDDVEDVELDGWITIYNLGVVIAGKGYGKQLVAELQNVAFGIEAINVLEESAGFWSRMGFTDQGEDANGEPYYAWTK